MTDVYTSGRIISSIRIVIKKWLFYKVIFLCWFYLKIVATKEDNMTEKILKLKKEKNAVVLAHYYVPWEVQAVADYIGDSYYLSKKAKETNADIIVFCGVRFMGESAVILNPDKKVLMPDLTADCAMAHMVTEEKIKDMRNSFDDLAVVCYINSTAKIKALSDVCVTSSNAVKIVKNLPNKNIFFVPDKNLGRYVQMQVKDKNIILNDGYCPVHAEITSLDVLHAKEKYPNAKFLVHPECCEQVVNMADFAGSTADIINYVSSLDDTEYIIGTEDGVFYELRKQNPEKKFYTVREKQICFDMKLVTLEKLYDILACEKNELTLDKETIDAARKPLERMLELAK